jgi:membrane protease YdiL (CAAX protease family)
VLARHTASEKTRRAAARARTLDRSYILALVATAALLAYGNLLSLLPDERRADVLLWTNALATVAAVVFATACGLQASHLGLQVSARDARAAVIGVSIALPLAIPPVAFILLAPWMTGAPVRADDIEHLSARGLAWRALVRIPLGTALPEEALFRGVLFALWHRAGGLRAAVGMSALAFALWHAVISLDTVSGAGTVDSTFAVGAGYLITLIALTVGGALFALLRWRTGSIAAPVMLHWTFNSVLALAVWARA